MPNSIAFDRAADFYDETRAFPPGVESVAVAAIARAAGLAGHERVLEFGVGTGRIALPLRPHVGQLVGLDLARPMMERLRAKPDGDRVGLVEADATRMPFAAASFDAALSVHVLHLIPNWQAALEEVARVLKPGAPYVHAWSENFHNQVWWNAWDAVTPRRNAQGVGVRLDSHRDFLDAHGWRRAGDEQAYVYSFQKTPRLFLEQLRNRIWSSTWEMTDAQLATGVAAVEAAMLREYHDLDVPITHTTGFYAQAYLPPR